MTIYYRVSTQAQGRSGLGLEAQQAAVEHFCVSTGCAVVGIFTEIESGKNNERPELAKALHLARVTNSTVLVAKLDRLSRNVAFLAQLQDAGVNFIAADMPQANEITIHVMAAVAQAERKAISQRTREALRAAKARGVRLGNPNGALALQRAGKGNGAALAAIRARAGQHLADIRPVVAEILGGGSMSLREIAGALNNRGIETARGGRFHAASVRTLLARLNRVTA